MGNKYDRHSTADIAETISAIVEARNRTARRPKVVVNGVSMNCDSLRLSTFIVKGTVCKSCGVKATHFAVERDMATANNGGSYHLNLWGINEHGHEVLFTHDHTHARGLGGKDSLENTEPMCSNCNGEKAKGEQIEVNRLRQRQDPNYMKQRRHLPPYTKDDS